MFTDGIRTDCHIRCNPSIVLSNLSCNFLLPNIKFMYNYISNFWRSFHVRFVFINVIVSDNGITHDKFFKKKLVIAT